jgi:hypothetical protein
MTDDLDETSYPFFRLAVGSLMAWGDWACAICGRKFAHIDDFRKHNPVLLDDHSSKEIKEVPMRAACKECYDNQM